MSLDHESGCEKDRPLPGECYVADMGLDQTETDFLHLVRMFLLFMTNPASKLLSDDVQEAVNRFEPETRSDIAMAMTDLFGAIHQIRKSPFSFSNPHCPTCQSVATENERHVMNALSAVRRGRKSKAHVAVMLICEGNPDEPVHTHLQRVASTIPETDDQMMRHAASEDAFSTSKDVRE